jgi:hypothetical protein
MYPIQSCDDWQLYFLQEFALFIERWEQSGSPGLTKETFLAIKHTCLAVKECTIYLINQRGFDNVLLGFLQSDPIESRFGWLRQMSGANYFISMRQVLDSDRKIRAVSLLKFSKFSLSEIDEIIKSTNSFAEDSENSTTNDVNNTITDNICHSLTYNQLPTTSDANIIYYISGYIGRSVCRITKCDDCRDILTDHNKADLEQPHLEDGVIPSNSSNLFQSINRGGLKPPTEFAYTLTVHCWRIYEEIRSTDSLLKQFLQVKMHRNIFYEIMDRATCHDCVIDYGLNNTMCVRGHNITKFVCDRFFNCVAKNLVKHLTIKANPNEAQAKKRKIDKLTSKRKE